MRPTISKVLDRAQSRDVKDLSRPSSTQKSKDDPERSEGSRTIKSDGKILGRASLRRNVKDLIRTYHLAHLWFAK